MKYGLIGEKLSHSFSSDIHFSLSGEEYELKELRREELKTFFEKREFSAINVTIPYKSDVIALLDFVDKTASEIGAVNTVINKSGKLYGYNTDYLGLKALIEKNGVSLKGKTVLILGTGGTSLTAKKVVEDMGAALIKRVSRSEKEEAITYSQAKKEYNNAQIIINTTPLGMFPQTDAKAVDLDAFEKLEAVFDVVYNPLRTCLVLEARKKGLTAEGGLYMLVAQAVFASEYFLDKKYEKSVLDSVFKELLAKKENIALTGMPGSGKTTVGKLLAKGMDKEFIDTDVLIEQREGKSISRIFKEQGEEYFRTLESEIIKELSQSAGGKIIATGGGAVLKKENVINLKKNSKIYFLNRDIENIIPTSDRPLASDREALEKRFKERFEIYKGSADVEINVNCDAEKIAEEIRKDFLFES